MHSGRDDHRCSDGEHGVKVCDDLGELREFLNIQNYSLPSQKLKLSGHGGSI